MTATENDDGGFIQIDISITRHHDHVGLLVWLHATILTVIDWTCFTADAWTLMTAREKLGASLVAW